MEDKEKIKLLCLRGAGASALGYLDWEKKLDSHIIVTPIEYPGRGLRFRERLCDDFDELIDRIFDYAASEIKDTKYAFFGFCIGSIVAYELYKRIKINKLREPSHCFICGRSAPNLPKMDKPIKDMSKDEIKDEILRIGLIPEKDFNDSGYIDKFIRVYKSDCTIMDNYRFTYPISKFNCNLTLLSGKEDTFLAPSEMVDKWEEFSTGKSNKYVIEGAHNFIDTNQSTIIDIINKTI